MGISSWPASERPRERLLAKGAGALTDAELIAVLLRTGVRGKSAVDLAREMIERFKGVKGLLAPAADLQAIKGLGSAKRAQLEAAYNWAFVKEDKSLGVHNTAYAVGLLKASIADLTKK